MFKDAAILPGVGAKMAGGLIAYKTRLEPTVALSSTEAEFMAACDAAKCCYSLEVSYGT
jgi:hypothetical protein